MTELQTVVLNILAYVDRLCRENNLRYYLAYGTLLGGVRHKGFIPWDDDIDIWMPRQDYMKLLKLFHKKQDSGRYVLSAGKYKPTGDRPEVLQMRILDRQVEISRGFSVSETIISHPWIDIFSLDQYPQTQVKRYIRNFKRELFFYKVARAKKYVIKEKSFYGVMNRILYDLHNKYHLQLKWLDEDKLIKKAYWTISQYSKNTEDNGMSLFCYAAVYLPNLEKCLFEMSWFGDPIEIQFENKKFYAPCNSHEILKKIYNDYMKLPPIEERHNTHSARIVTKQ